MKNIFFFGFLILLVGCNGFSEQSLPPMGKTASLAEDLEMGEVPPPPTNTPPPQQAEEAGAKPEATPRVKKIIRDGDMQLEVEDVKTAKMQVDSVVKKFRAYYEQEAFESSDYQSTFRLKIRVPAGDFDQLVDAVSQQGGEIRMKTINARDVTEQFYDISTRLENNESFLSQYRTLLKRANSIPDILEVQEKIRVLEEEIDAKKGSLRYISDQVNYSTLNLILTQRHEWQDKNRRSFGEKVVDALQDGGRFFVSFLLLIIRLWPFVLLFGVVVLLFRRWRSRNRSQR